MSLPVGPQPVPIAGRGGPVRAVAVAVAAGSVGDDAADGEPVGEPTCVAVPEVPSGDVSAR